MWRILSYDVTFKRTKSFHNSHAGLSDKNKVDLTTTCWVRWLAEAERIDRPALHGFTGHTHRQKYSEQRWYFVTVHKITTQTQHKHLCHILTRFGSGSVRVRAVCVLLNTHTWTQTAQKNATWNLLFSDWTEGSSWHGVRMTVQNT